MRAWLVVGLVAGWAAVCVAQPPTVELCVTRASEFQAINAPYTFELAARDFRPHFNGFGGAPVSVIDTSGGDVADTLYVWGRFVDVPDYARVRELNLLAEVAGGIGPVGENAMYRHRVTGANPWRRWDGTQPLRFTDQDGAPAIALVSNGIVNWTPQDTVVDLFDPATRRFASTSRSCRSRRCADRRWACCSCCGGTDGAPAGCAESETRSSRCACVPAIRERLIGILRIRGSCVYFMGRRTRRAAPSDRGHAALSAGRYGRGPGAISA